MHQSLDHQESIALGGQKVREIDQGPHEPPCLDHGETFLWLQEAEYVGHAVLSSSQHKVQQLGERDHSAAFGQVAALGRPDRRPCVCWYARWGPNFLGDAATLLGPQ